MVLIKRSKSILRQILLYSLSVSVPIALVFASLVYNYTALRQEICSSNNASLELVQTSLDSSFQDLYDMLNIAGNDPSLSRHMLLADPLSASGSIKDIVNTHSCLLDLVLYVRDSEQYCSANGCFDINGVVSQNFAKDFSGSGSTIETWQYMMQNVTETSYWVNAKKSQTSCLYIITPVYYLMQPNGAIASRTACIAISQDYIKEILLSSQSASEEGMLIMSPSGMLLSKLTSRNTDGYVSEVCDYIRTHPEIYSEDYAQLPGSNLLVFASRSADTGLTYVRFLSADLAYNALQTQSVFSFVFLILSVLIGIILIRTNISNSCRPILRLNNWLRGIDTAADSDLLPPASNLLSLKTVPDNLRKSMLDHFLADLLSGSCISEDAFQEACTSLNIRLDKPYFAACSLLIESDSSGAQTVNFDRIFDAIRAGTPACYQIRAKDLLLAGKLVLVISSDNDDPALYQSTMQEIITRLSEQEQLTVSIGMGRFYESYTMIGKSYQDSISALDYRLIYGKNCLITPDISGSYAPELAESYSNYDLLQFESALSSRNTDMVREILQRLRAAVMLRNSNVHTAQKLFMDISSILKKHSALFNPVVEDMLPTADNDGPFTPDTVDSFFDALSAQLLSALSTPVKPEPLIQTDIGAQLLEYIDKHCLSYNFQIKNMAEHFAISPQYMRKLFKAHTGISLSEYVSNKRLEKATHLLSKTDMPLQDIVSEIGNSDISGFVRFFKQKTGMTPGQFRKAQKEQD